MHLRTRLFHSALLAISLIPPGAARAGLAHSAPALDPRAIQADELAPIFAVPFPRSLRLLDVLEGSRRAEPAAQRTQYPEQWEGAPAFGPEESAALLELLLGATQQELHLMREMRALAADSLGSSSRGRTRRALPPETNAVAEFRLRLQDLERLVRTTSLRGHALLTGTTPVLFLFQPPPSGALQRVTILDLSTRTHGLDRLDIAADADASEALDLIDTALVYVTAAHERYLLDRQSFREGRPEGGLREVEEVLERLREIALLAADTSRDEDEHLLLDSHYQSDVARLDALSARAYFENVPLLRGGLVLLEGRGIVGMVQFFRLPDTAPDHLGVDTDVSSWPNALAALQLLDAARSRVRQERTRLERVREQLLGGGPRPR
jgi:hypothetical protein